MRYKLLLTSLICTIVLISSTIDFNNLFNYSNLPISTHLTSANNFEDDLPNDNQITDVGATLGRVLFYDKKLSLNNTISCGSCHQQEFAFSDTDQVSTGFDGGVTGRHSMRLVNARYVNEDDFFWDERANSLEDQTTEPIQDVIEMGWSGNGDQPDLDSLIRKMDATSYYAPLFNAAFGSNTITEDRMQRAISQFIRSIISFDSKYDTGLTAANGNLNSNFSNFTDSENRGKNLYMQNRQQGGAGCQNCHRAPIFDIRGNTNNNGVITVANNPGAQDFENTRSPTLRDLVNPSGALNGPMMHDGSFTTIRQMIDHYNDVPFNNQLDNRLRQGGQGQNLNLTEQEKVDLEAFLLTLTGSNMYTDEKYSDPFDQDGNLDILFADCQLVSSEMTQDVASQTMNVVVQQEITSASSITGNSTVLYKAGNSVSLNSDFSVEEGSTFTIEIESCPE